MVQGNAKPMNTITPGNIVRGKQKLCKGNLYGCNWPGLTALEKGKQTGTVMILSFQTDRSEQTVQTQIRLLL